MVDTDRLWEKLYPAAWKLARSADPIHTRISDAFLSFHDLNGEEFRPEERIIYNEITARMTRAGPVLDKGEITLGAVPNTLASMDEGEACEIAESIFELFVQVAEQHFKD